MEVNTNHPHTDVLVIDDEEDIRELLELSLLRMGLECDAVGSVDEARKALQGKTYRLCLTDMRLPDGDGLEVVEYIQNHCPDLPVAVITAFGSMETAIRSMKLGAFDFVTKPIELKKLKALVHQALKLETTEQTAEATVPRTRLIGGSPGIVQLRSQIAKVARSQAPVFICGESGTGKEVVARLIHETGPRAGGPFVPVNCGAISPELMESEFFGYRKNSFTGAVSDKDGLFQAASGGTLFLDEVADLPLPMQVKLLRAIQERAVRPVGAQAEEPVDVRILSASHQNLAALVEEKRFRQDLYFRINVITLAIPPLRERREDIPELAEHILNKLAERDQTAPSRLADSAVDLLYQYVFPGNIRELENLLERACALSENAEITAKDIHIPSGGSPLLHEVITPSPIEPSLPSDEELGDEREVVIKTLERYRWNRSAAARKLGMTLRQLRYRLQKWGIE